MRNETIASAGGEVVDKPKLKKPSRDERIAAWRKENRAAFEAAHKACCVCTPTRAQMLLIDQFIGNVNPPID